MSLLLLLYGIQTPEATPPPPTPTPTISGPQWGGGAGFGTYRPKRLPFTVVVVDDPEDDEDDDLLDMMMFGP